MAGVSRRENPGIIQNIIELLAAACEEKKLMVCISNSVKGGLVTGICSLLGGIVMGRQGVLAGAIIGGIASSMAIEDFKPLSEIIKEMDADKKRKLFEKLKRTFSDIGLVEITGIMTAITSQTDIRELALREVTNYVTQDLGLRII